MRIRKPAASFLISARYYDRLSIRRDHVQAAVLRLTLPCRDDSNRAAVRPAGSLNADKGRAPPHCLPRPRETAAERLWLRGCRSPSPAACEPLLADVARDRLPA